MDAAWTPRERLFFGVTLAGGLAWSALVMLLSPGWSLDDELAHYLRSRSVWENPVLIFDVWTRIGRNLFHVLPALFGLTAARLWTLAFAGIAVVITAHLATRLGSRRGWLAPLLLCFQPWFVELSWGVLTQTPFMLLLAGGVLGLAGNRLILSGLCFGALPLIRHEGIALTGLWVALVAGRTLFTARAEWRHALLAVLLSAAPLAAYNLAAWICLREFPSRLLFAAKPTEIYGHGTLWHFVPISILPIGIFTLLLGLAGLPSLLRQWRRTWPLVVFPAYFALHSLIYWKGLFASGGYYHFLMPMAPGFAVAAIFGADALLRHRHILPRTVTIALIAGVLLQGLWVAHLSRGALPHPALPRDQLTLALDDALAWQKRERPLATVVCRHVYAAFRENWLETPARRHLERTALAALPTGAIVIWESKYADLTGLPLTAFRRDPAWVERAIFGDGSVRVLEKLP